MEIEKSNLNESRWERKYFKEYLLALGRGKEYLLPLKNYPRKIELLNDLNNLLTNLRKETFTTGKEHWALLGLKPEKSMLFTQKLPAKGLSDRIPWELILGEMKRAQAEAGIDTIIADFHSHPRNIFEHLAEIVTRGTGFSPADFYGQLIPGAFRPLAGVTDGGDNFFAFLSKESQTLGIKEEVPDQEAFEKIWFEKNGFKYLGSIDKFGASRAIPIYPNSSLWNVNMAIAENYNLALYRGYAGAELVREWPR